jgi:hypothetical protein
VSYRSVLTFDRRIPATSRQFRTAYRGIWKLDPPSRKRYGVTQPAYRRIPVSDMPIPVSYHSISRNDGSGSRLDASVSVSDHAFSMASHAIRQTSHAI